MNSPTILDTVKPSVRQSTEPGNSSTPRSDIDAISRQRILADDDLNDYLIDHVYRLMKSAATEDSRLHWGERLAHYTRRRFSELEMKKALGVVS